MKDLKTKNSFEITGRGLVFVTSLTENNLHINDLKIGQEVIIENVVRKIRGIEMARNGFGAVQDTIGILVS
jgi:hypothetical protein